MEHRYRVVIDNDFSGDPDDLFQLAHHLLSPSVEVCAIIGSHLAPGDPLDPSPNSARNAAGAAQELLEVMGLSGCVPVYAGSATALAGSETPIPTEASQAIISEALKDSPAPLFVACGAGLTDVASALLQKPEIAGRMTLVWIGGPEYPDLAAPPPGSQGIEYNLHIDVDAAMHVFNRSRVPIWQVPRNAYRQCIVSLAELEERVLPQGKLGSFLFRSLDRMFSMLGQDKWTMAGTYVLGDQPLVLLTALQTLFEADPASCESFHRATPGIEPDGTYRTRTDSRPIRVFNRIDTRLMFEDFYARLAREARRERN
jgi:inosine-uridine nucleoside N-ribohydrolase